MKRFVEDSAYGLRPLELVCAYAQVCDHLWLYTIERDVDVYLDFGCRWSEARWCNTAAGTWADVANNVVAA